jgi:hypothetical protein
MSDLLEQTSKRVETILDRFSAFPATTGARADAEELVRITSSLHGECLRRIVEQLRDELGARADEVLERCCEDPLVAGVLVTHGLHPVPLEERVRRAVRDFEGAQVIGISEDVVEVRINGTEDIAQKLERAIYAAAPEVLDVRTVGQTISLLSLR